MKSYIISSTDPWCSIDLDRWSRIHLRFDDLHTCPVTHIAGVPLYDVPYVRVWYQRPDMPLTKPTLTIGRTLLQLRARWGVIFPVRAGVTPEQFILG